MQNTVFSLVALACLVYFPAANADPIARVTASQSPVWLQQGSDKTELSGGSDLAPGDQVNTGNDGRVEIQLWSVARLRVYPDSEVRLLKSSTAQPDSADKLPLLQVRQGRVCVDFRPEPDTRNRLEVSIGNTIITAMHHHSRICLQRNAGMSSVDLHDGSVQVTHAIDPSMFILSKTGTALQIDDNGSYRLLNPDTAALTIDDEKPFITEQDIKVQTPGPVTAIDETATTTGTVTEESSVEVDETSPDYIYTVYLFSTGLEDVANEVNQRFRKAGHRSEIIVTGKDDSRRYRVAVSGFESRQAAAEFSNAVVGKLGIMDTWIGRDRPSANPDAASMAMDDEGPFISEAASEVQIPFAVPAAVDPVAATADSVTEESKTEADETSPGYVYTVYLFSSRSEDVARGVNQKFQRAGHESKIIVVGEEGSRRYRVAVSGFESRQAAAEFSNAVVGKLGIRDAWIGRDREVN